VEEIVEVHLGVKTGKDMGKFSGIIKCSLVEMNETMYHESCVLNYPSSEYY
jgi:hypothetical protein